MKKRFGEVVTGVIVGLLVAAITALASYLIQLPLTTLLTVTVGASIIAAVGVASSLAWSRSHARARATRYLRSPPVAASEYLPIGPSGARWTPVGEILADPNLIVAQPWTQLSSPATRSQNNLSHVLLDHICSGSAAIVLGEPGIGKSLTIRQTFGLLAERYLSDPSRNPLPVLIPLGELPIATSPRDSADGDDPLDLTGVVATLTGIHPRAVRRLVRNEGLTLLLDALDESPALRSVNSMRAAARGAAFASVGLISSRGDHFQGFFALPGLAERFTLTTQLGPIPFDVRVPKFVHSYCRHFGLDRAAAILGFLESDEGHRDLTARPLTLWMIVDVLASLPSENHFSAVTLTSLYSQYSDKWLRIEAAKSGTQVLALADRRLLVRLAARSMFQAGTALGGSMRSTADLAATRSELAEFLAGADAGALLHALISRYGLDVLTDEICGRTFLVRGGYRDNYRFTHKSFFEYFVALDLRECLLGERRLDAATKYLERPLSDPIVYFFREMLAELRQYPDLSRLIAQNMLEILHASGASMDPVSQTVRQHVGNLVAGVVDTAGEKALMLHLETEPSAFVRRGITVGLALQKRRRDLIDQYVASLETDSAAAAIQIGYTRLYHGDQEWASHWADDGGKDVSRSVEAQVDRLVSQRNRELNVTLWPLTLFTLGTLLEDGRAWNSLLQEPHSLRDLADFVAIHRPEQGQVFERQRARVLDLLQQHHHGPQAEHPDWIAKSTQIPGTVDGFDEQSEH